MSDQQQLRAMARELLEQAKATEQSDDGFLGLLRALKRDLMEWCMRRRHRRPPG